MSYTKKQIEEVFDAMLAKMDDSMERMVSKGVDSTEMAFMVATSIVNTARSEVIANKFVYKD